MGRNGNQETTSYPYLLVFIGLSLIILFLTQTHAALLSPPKKQVVQNLSVEALAKDTDAFLKEYKQYQKANKIAKKISAEKLKRLALNRQKNLKKAINEDPGKALKLIVPQEVKGALPKDIQNVVEQEQVVKGFIREIHQDVFNKNDTDSVFLVHNETDYIAVKLVNQNAADLVDQRVEVRTLKVNNELIGEATPVLEAAEPMFVAAAPSNFTYTLRIIVEGDGRIAWWPRAPGNESCSTTCVLTFPAGSPVTLTAYAFGTESRFVQWGDEECADGTGSTPYECVLTMTQDKTAIARFSTNKTKKFAVFLVNFQNEPNNRPTDATAIRNLIFGPSNSVKSYYKEVSYNSVEFTGKTRVDGDVFGWYTLPVNSYPCDFTGSWTTETYKRAARQNISLASYDYIIIAFPQTSCNFAGSAGVNTKEAWINGAFTVHSIGHEIGHMLGVHHASSLERCTDGLGNNETISANCKTIEYGDPYDIMGIQNPGHFNAFHKAQLGYLTAKNIIEVNQSGNYSIFPLEVASNGTQLLRIARPVHERIDTGYYYLEYRQPLGLDIFPYYQEPWVDPIYSSVALRVGPDYSQRTQSYLLRPYLSVGKRYFDFDNNLSILLTRANATRADLEILFTQPFCVREKPFVAFNENWQRAPEYSYTLYIVNSDKFCPPAAFNVSFVFHKQLGIAPVNKTITLASGESYVETVIINANNTNGVYPLSVSVLRERNNSISTIVSKTIEVTIPPQLRVRVEGEGMVGGGFGDEWGGGCTSECSVTLYSSMMIFSSSREGSVFTGWSGDYCDGSTYFRCDVPAATKDVHIKATFLKPLDPTEPNLWYTFNRDMLDISGHQEELFVEGNPSYANTWDAVTVLSLNGVDDAVRISNLQGITPNEFTFSIWVKKSLESEGKDSLIAYLFGKAGFIFTDGDYAVYQSVSDDFWPTNNWDHGGSVFGEIDTKWHHLAVTYNGSIATTYFDGVLAGESQPHTNIKATSNEVLIGHEPNYDRDYFQGMVDEMLMYNRSLTSEEIERIYDLQYPGHQYSWF